MKDTQDYFIRIDPRLAEKVKELAKLERRTIRAETEMLIERGLAAFESGRVLK